MGLEPTNGGITIHCLNHLATPAIHTVILLYHHQSTFKYHSLKLEGLKLERNHV